MAFEMDNLTESGVDDVRDRGNGAGKGKAQMQPAGESGEDPLGEDRQGLLTHLRGIYCATVDISANPAFQTTRPQECSYVNVRGCCRASYQSQAMWFALYIAER
ncbi:hypothetical protein E4U37_001665 [Claviceps purpurea]|nr:hypothetical protein E4U37_001665 [Claviceps purpurea]